MSYEIGTFTGYRDYVKKSARPKAKAFLWDSGSISDALRSATPDVQGAIALTNDASEFATTVAPGISIIIQTLAPQESSPLHSHSFWHLYIVQSGAGIASVGTAENSRDLGEGDILFVPAWTPHAVSNPNGTELLVLVRLQNLPELADIGALAREIDNAPRLVYFEE